MKQTTALLALLIMLSISQTSFAQKTKVIRWDSLNQSVTISKGDFYEFLYRNNLNSDWTFIELQQVPGEDEYHTLQLKTNSVPPIVFALPPDTVYIPCPGEGEPEFGFKDISATGNIIKKPERTIMFREFGQVEKVRFCESVNIIYEEIAPEDVQILYESIDDGYLLHLKRIGERKLIEFKCICQTFILSNPESTSMSFDPRLKYEQIIWTPMENNLWEVRLGSTQRDCKSRALDRIKVRRNAEYEKNLPRNCGK